MGLKQISSKEGKKQSRTWLWGIGDGGSRVLNGRASEPTAARSLWGVLEERSKEPGGSSVSWTEVTGEVIHCVLGGLI